MLIATNTKARRLGYLKLFVEFLTIDDGKHGCVTRFAHYASDYESHLRKYKDLHGEIVAGKKPRASAKPYTDLAESLLLVIKKDKRYFLDPNAPGFEGNDNPFLLTDSEKMFYYKLFLKYDMIGLFLLFVMLSNVSISYKELCSHHDSVTLELIDRLNKDHFLTPTLNLLADNTDNRLAKDSFLLPRLHWYLDLGFIQLAYTKTKYNREELSTISLLPKGVLLKAQIMEMFYSMPQLSKQEFETKMKLTAL